jgi:hypothetical protein
MAMPREIVMVWGQASSQIFILSDSSHAGVFIIHIAALYSISQQATFSEQLSIPIPNKLYVQSTEPWIFSL